MNSNTGSKCAVGWQEVRGRVEAFAQIESLEARLLLSTAQGETPLMDFTVAEDSPPTLIDLSGVFPTEGGENRITFSNPVGTTPWHSRTIDDVNFTAVTLSNTPPLRVDNDVPRIFDTAPEDWRDELTGGYCLQHNGTPAQIDIVFPSPASSISFLLVEGNSAIHTVEGFNDEGVSLGEFVFTTPPASLDTPPGPDQAIGVALPFVDAKRIELRETVSSILGTFLDDLRFRDSISGGGVVEISVPSNTNQGLVTTLLDGTDLTLTYARDQYGTADITVRATGEDPADFVEDTFTVTVANLVDLSGVVFEDFDNDGEKDAEDAGIGGVQLDLFQPVEQAEDIWIATTWTAVDSGAYRFNSNLAPGTYKIVETQPEGYLDGLDSGTAIADIVVAAGDDDSGGYDFAEILPASVQGMVWSDFNDDGGVNFEEKVIPGAAVALTGADDRGEAVTLTTISDADGIYTFENLRPSDANGYTIAETQPEGYDDGIDTLGAVDGETLGDDTVNDVFSGVVVVPGSVAENYNFGERPVADGSVTAGQTAGIGFWQNKHGQSLIKALNGGSTSKQLGNWLAATFPNLYGELAGANNLAGMENAEIAEFYSGLFKQKKLKDSGPAKVEAQVMATALAVYVTNETLAGTTAEAYGFLVSEYGAGISTFNVGTSGDAFGVADYTVMTVLDLLKATNEQTTVDGMYDLDDENEVLFRTLANEVYSDINSAGSI